MVKAVVEGYCSGLGTLAEKVADGEGTAKEKNNQIKKALTSIFDTNTFKELPQQTKQAFQDLIASLFNLSDIQVDFNTGEVTDFTTQTINALQNAINAAIGTKFSKKFINSLP